MNSKQHKVKASDLSIFILEKQNLEIFIFGEITHTITLSLELNKK